MKRTLCATTFVFAMLLPSPAFAWDPDQVDPIDPGPAPGAWTPEPAPVPPPPGIYLVTDTYAGDSITRAGDVTTYSTETVHEITGSYARVLDTVGTGTSSTYDGAAFNGRAVMTDGRAVAGTYYENYVPTDSGFVAVSIVFFQDDSEVARASRAAWPQPGPSAVPVAGPGSGPSAPAGASPSFDAFPLPSVGGVRGLPGVPVGGAVAPGIDQGAAPPGSAFRPAPPSAPLPDRSIEVLRGRRTVLSFDGPDVLAWRLVSGECVPLGPLAGGPADPFTGRWDRLASPGESWVTRFAIGYADGITRELVVRVAVRAPGLVE